MKNRSILFALVMTFSSTALFAQNRETRTVDSFTKIDFKVAGKCYVRQGSTQKVEVSGSRETLAKIVTEVDGGRLSVGTEKKWKNWNWHDDDIKVYITVTNIESINVSGSGDLIAETKLTSRDFYIGVSGSGSMEAELDASGDVEAKVSGSGNLDLKGRFKSFESDVSGSGDIRVAATIAGDASFDLSGSGKVVASGSAQKVKASISGSGEVRAADLNAESCDVHISGSGDVQISVRSSLDASISGSGTVSYRGDPSHVNSHASGSGSVRKM